MAKDASKDKTNNAKERKFVPKERKYAMYEAILQLKDMDECCRFFDDLCAVTELRAMEQRYEVASMLMEDKVYMEIMEKSNASSATISRVNRMLNYGTGCLPEMIRRVNESGVQQNKNLSDSDTV